ncbi:hypothetical protein Nepgr_027313 [Nepenthes gracilis]|uniref:DYW domain-containing protein n=1 Tax=Nepenthes gracilis TaxID=150966 RepID=A0AAD3Y2U5_NEPGR|nr:hypothetical protein Nepgr_027313 [Nepenthes gracilis]
MVGKALHCLCLKGLTYASTFYSNTLVNMYSQFGDIDAAWYLFDKMPQRNDASWNTMMSGFVRLAFYSEAFGLFHKMMGGDIRPNGFVIASLITACNRSQEMVNEGFQIHSLVLKCGLLYDVFVCTSLLYFYGTYGFLTEAHEIFKEMPCKNVVSWTSLMVGCSDAGQSEEVVSMYRQMRREGFECNENTFTIVISSCGMLEYEGLGYQVLGHVLKSGFEYNVSVANSLVWMFGNFGSLEESCYVFYNMEERDTISWNSMIAAFAHNSLWEEALGCFTWMRRAHDEVNAATLSSLLLTCDTVDRLKCGRAIHGLAVKFGLDLNVCLCNTLISMYSSSGSTQDAEFLFQEMPHKDLISWNSMLTCHSQQGRCMDALRLLAELLETRMSVNHVTFASALAACSSQEFLAQGKAVHALAIVAGLQDNIVVGNALVTLYGKCGLMIEAQRVFQVMPQQDIITWNALIGGHAENEEPNDALKVFCLMRRGGLPVNYITVVNVLASFSSPPDLIKKGMPIHAHIVCSGLESDEYVKNSLITMYAKCGDLNSCGSVFSSLANITSVTYNSMIAANARHGRGEDALKLFVEMYNERDDLDQFSFASAFAAAANLAILEEGQMLHALVTKLGVDLNLYVANAAMDMYGKCGEINDVIKLLPPPLDRSRLSWNILISAYARHGILEKARGTFHEMHESGMKPDHVTFVSLLSACSHKGFVDEGLAYYASMTTEFGVPPAIEHCVCMVDLLGRSGRFSEVENFIKEMPVPPNGLVWRSLLSSCRIHGNLELGNIAAQHLIELGPSDDSAYVLYSNVCATTGKWEDVESVRSHMEMSNIKKQPACSWVKLKNKVSSFGMGDQSHPQAEKIHAKLKELKKLIAEAGYVPDTSFALHDTDEEQKEHNLWSHSERIALAYALIHTPQGSSVRVYKNLRVCGDCHWVFKYVSAIVASEIILRDPYRFHHFRGGKCSCDDYW